MTRAQVPGVTLQFRTFGAPAAPRLIVAVRTGAAATTDPDPSVTATRDVRLMAVRLEAAELDDPPAFGGETPAEMTTSAVADLVERATSERTIGVVGERAAGGIAAALAARLAARVDRLALVGVAMPATPLDRDLAAELLAGVTADVLILNAEDDPSAPPESGAWYRERLPAATAETAAPQPESTDPRLGLGDVWARVLDHLAPGRTRG